ncbi:MAG: TraB/GumN family protein [Pseudomonadales bacterium]|nr:TraB/GumN family protein [Pseudomonadales bacterium]
MNAWQKLCLLCLFIFSSHGLAYAGSPVWKVSKGESLLYIGGTIHVLSESDYPLSAEFDKAYAQSQTLVFETDIQAMQSPEFQQKVMKKMFYTEGESLKQVLSEETYKLLDQHLTSRGIPIARMENIKPGMVSMTLTVMELQRLGLGGKGVDEHFNSLAVRDKKNLLALETVDEQLAFIEKLGLGQEDEFIRYTLRDINDLAAVMQVIKTTWRSGDVEKMEADLLAPFKRDFPEVYNNLLVKRNKAWVPQVVAMAKSDEVEFVLVGALHLVGKDSLLAELKALGFSVEML